MKKDKAWLKRQLEQMDIGWEESHPEYHRACGEALKYVNQLEEPELTVIPQFVADWIEEFKSVDDDFWEAVAEMIRDSRTDLTEKGREVHNWLLGNSISVTEMLERQELITRAWLSKGGYTIEPEQPKTHQVLVKFFDNKEYKTELTEDAARELIEFLEANKNE